MTTHLLLIESPDAMGLVYKITGVLFHRGFNIVSNHEFVDPATRHFFMRTAFDGDASPQSVIDELRGLLPPAATIRLASTGKRPVVVLATKEPHCLGDLLLRHSYGELPARIEAVISNHATLEPLARQFGIPFQCVSHKFCTRSEHEREILRLLKFFRPDYIVLAKYMRTLTPQFLEHYPNRIINIHHSFLPAFVGANPYHQAFTRGVKIIGATAHVVTQDLDTGPIIAQGVLPVDHTHTAEDMAQAGRDVEKIVLAKALKLVLEERVFLHSNRTIVFE
ncbi:MAG TPA: formyltetrahydrofolate deformylase [Planctomycetota bacterium]|nr:formyltetrahydrofolate deformylase [Planctomycetota bacterium]